MSRTGWKFSKSMGELSISYRLGIKMNELINCDDCKCNIDGHCYRFPPIPHFVSRDWDIRRPRTDLEERGCFSGITKDKVDGGAIERL